MRVASTGWLSLVFDPMTTTSEAFSMSAMEPESPPYPTVRLRPMVAGVWQYREQLSMLLVPMTARASFCIR